MKNKTIILFLILFLNSILFTQWTILDYVNTTQLNCVKFFDANTGITSGAGGIWRTINRGYNWANVLNSTSSINSISFPDRINGIAVGDSGKIFKSIDSGKTWQQLTSPVICNLYSVSTGSPIHGYAVGAQTTILRTGDGMNWGINLQYTNGNNYSVLNLPILTESYVTTVNQYGWGGIYYTENEGVNWSNVTGYTNGTQLNSIFCINNSFQQPIYVGNNGIIAKSTNSGINFIYPASNTTMDLYDITFSDNNMGWCNASVGNGQMNS